MSTNSKSVWPSGRAWRRLGAIGLGLVVLAAALGGEARVVPPAGAAQEPARPNILWLSSEDTGPQLGAYGDTYATTPKLDALANRGYRYRTVWSNGPVCGAARTALITGVYPEATGGEHMRSLVSLPGNVKLYPTLLREAGYYVTNNAKTDYNYPEVGQVWDESSGNAHWKNRPAGKPFFAIFNIGTTHEGQVRTRPHTWIHDVATAPVPSYTPNIRESREDWAQYYDKITEMDATAGERLAELEAAGLVDDTIVMYFGDHGAGLPRSKRFVYNSGLQVPLIVYIPEKFRALGPPEASRPGSESQRLVSFVDFAPTLVSLSGQRPPAWMQGRAFLGPHAAPEAEFLFGFRGRMDERYDLVRSVRDRRYVYLRNYMPHRPHGQHVAYLFQTPSTAAWKRLYDEGRLEPHQSAFWEPKASEELYDLDADPFETRNLAESAEHAAALQRMRAALDAHTRDVRDVGFLPEYEFYRDDARTVYERRLDPKGYDFDRVYETARRATDRSLPYADVRSALTDANPVVRYWAATGAIVRGRDAVLDAVGSLEALLADAEPAPRIAAAEALGRFGPPAFRDRAIANLVRDAHPATWSGFSERAAVLAAQLALYTLNQFEGLPQSVKDDVAKLPPVGGRGAGRGAGVNEGAAASSNDGGRGRGAAPGTTALARGDYRAGLRAAILADVR